MTYFCVDKNGSEWMVDTPGPTPVRLEEEWYFDNLPVFYLPKGTIKNYLGYNLTWEDDPVKLEIKLYNSK